MWDKMFRSADLLQRGMSAAWTRDAVLRHNLANSETPGFKTSDVAFESLYLEAMREAAEAEKTDTGLRPRITHARHIDFNAPRSYDAADFESIRPRIYQNDDISMRMDGNNVDTEAENVKLASNRLKYDTMLTKLNSELRRIKLAISEGR